MKRAVLGSIDLPLAFLLMIYDMVTLSVLVASYADLTLIFFFFELHFIPQSTIKEKKPERHLFTHCNSFKLALPVDREEGIGLANLSGRTMINNTRQLLPLLEYSLTPNIT